jgi:hypothetical protein
MKIEQKSWTKETGWQQISKEKLAESPQWVLMFGGRKLLEEGERFKEVRAMYQSAHIISCSTAGEILDTEVRDNSISLTAIFFERTKLEFAAVEIKTYAESYEAGKSLAKKFSPEGLVHVMVFSDGQRVNGTQLVRGLNENLPPTVAVTGGLYISKMMVEAMGGAIKLEESIPGKGTTFSFTLPTTPR